MVVPKGQDVRANRGLARREKARNRAKKSVLHGALSRSTGPSQPDTLLGDPLTSSATRRLSTIDRKSHPGRKARRKDDRKARLRCRKPRPKSCKRVGWGRCPRDLREAVLPTALLVLGPIPELGLTVPALLWALPAWTPAGSPAAPPSQ